MYKTGDLGAYNERGELMFLGRKDSQIKKQGCRIELGEIECAIKACQAVTQGCCFYQAATQQIVCCYSGEDDEKALRGELRRRLPKYMLPDVYYHLPQFPQTMNGKSTACGSDRSWDCERRILEFLGFLAALAVVYYILPMRVRKWALLAGSAAFWLLCGWQGAAYLTAETLLIWGCARLMGRFSERRGVCRALLVGGMVTVFGAMVLMKALSQMEALPDGLLVPIGLSYFTFQSVGYLIDVYRGKVTPEKNYAKVLLFAGFFPQMTQGPITTWKQLMPQLDSPHRLSPNGFVSGVFLMAWGFSRNWSSLTV